MILFPPINFPVNPSIGGGGSAPPLAGDKYFTDNALANDYFTDNSTANRYYAKDIT